MNNAVLSLAGITRPNVVSDKGAYYISYNPVDVGLYGDVTTAIVTGQMEHFYVLNGNHKNILQNMSCLNECLEYFAAHPELHNKYSEKITKEVL